MSTSLPALAGSCRALTEGRIFGSAWLLFGWPSRLALLLHESTMYEVFAELTAHYETNEELKARDSRHLRGTQLRSPCRRPCVWEIAELLRANGWAANHRFLETISLGEGGLKQSRVVEDGFLKKRRAETATTQMEMAELSASMSLAQCDISSSRFAFQTHAPKALLTACLKAFDNFTDPCPDIRSETTADNDGFHLC